MTASVISPDGLVARPILEPVVLYANATVFPSILVSFSATLINLVSVVAQATFVSSAFFVLLYVNVLLVVP